MHERLKVRGEKCSNIGERDREKSNRPTFPIRSRQIERREASALAIAERSAQTDVQWRDHAKIYISVIRNIRFNVATRLARFMKKSINFPTRSRYSRRHGSEIFALVLKVNTAISLGSRGNKTIDTATCVMPAIYRITGDPRREARNAVCKIGALAKDKRRTYRNTDLYRIMFGVN